MSQRQRSSPSTGDTSGSTCGSNAGGSGGDGGGGGGGGGGGLGLLDEQILVLVFASMNWDPRVLGQVACVNQKVRAIAKRVLWRELCLSRAPRMVSELTSSAPGGRAVSGWDALAKMMFHCCGFGPSAHFAVGRVPGHFVTSARFSKTSGKSFLSKRCRGDLLYVSDPCEHVVGPNEDDVGVYRGVFRAFTHSQTWASLVRRQVQLEQTIRCPYCGARVWSMTRAQLVPRSASRRLGSREGQLDYFVCINGHLHGTCQLAHLTTDDGSDDGDDNDEDDGDDKQ